VTPHNQGSQRSKMKEGIISGIIVLAIGGVFTWYFSDIRDTTDLNLRAKHLESDQAQLSNKLDQLSEKINLLNTQYARIDERVNILTKFNTDKLADISKSKNIPQNQVDKAIDFLNTNPNPKDAAHYLQMNLGLSPNEVKAVVKIPPLQ
jgi:chromosome segregation ATPase